MFPPIEIIIIILDEITISLTRCTHMKECLGKWKEFPREFPREFPHQPIKKYT